MLQIRKFSSGITLIELLTVMTVAGILLTLSFPMFTGMFDRVRVKADAETFYFFAQNARIEAIKQNANVYISFTTGDDWCYGANTGSSCTCTTPSSCNLGVNTPSSANKVNLSSSGFTSNNFYFEGTRGAANDSGTITFTAYNQSSPLISTTINRLGSISQCATGINNFAAC